MPIINITLIQYNFFVDILSTNQHVRTSSDSLLLVDTLKSSPKYENIKDTLTLQHYENIGGVKFNVSLTDTLILIDKVFRSYSFNITDLITLFEPESFVDNLNFTDILIAYATTPINDQLTFTDLVLTNRLLNIHLTDNLLFNSNSFGFNIPHGFNSDSPGTPIVNQIYTDPLPITHHINVIFTGVNNEQYVIFRPSFGNLYKTQFNYIQSETRGRALVQAGNNTYPYVKSIKSLNFTFEYMTQAQGQGLITFLNKNFGLPVTILDHENITYNGIIITPELQLTQEDKNNYSTTFDFEILP